MSRSYTGMREYCSLITSSRRSSSRLVGVDRHDVGPRRHHFAQRSCRRTPPPIGSTAGPLPRECPLPCPPKSTPPSARTGDSLFLLVLVGLRSSTSDWKNPSTAVSGRTSTVSIARSKGASGSSQRPLVLRYSICGITYVKSSIAATRAAPLPAAFCHNGVRRVHLQREDQQRPAAAARYASPARTPARLDCFSRRCESSSSSLKSCSAGRSRARSRSDSMYSSCTRVTRHSNSAQ